MKKIGTFLWVLLVALAFSAGCAGIISFDVPEEFKGKKTIEDPPLSQAPVFGREKTA